VGRVVWNSRVLSVGKGCGVVGYCVWGERCGVVGYCVWVESFGTVGYCVWREWCVVAGFVCGERGVGL